MMIEDIIKNQVTPLLLRNRPSEELNWGICFGTDKDGYKKLVQALRDAVQKGGNDAR